MINHIVSLFLIFIIHYLSVVLFFLEFDFVNYLNKLFLQIKSKLTTTRSIIDRMSTTTTSNKPGLLAAAQRRDKVKSFMETKEGQGLTYREAEAKMVELGKLQPSKKRPLRSPKAAEGVSGGTFVFVNPDKLPDKTYKLLDRPFYFRHTESKDASVPGVKLLVQVKKRDNVDKKMLENAKDKLRLYQAYKYHLINSEKLSEQEARERLSELKKREDYEKVARGYLSEYDNRQKDKNKSSKPKTKKTTEKKKVEKKTKTQKKD